MFADGRRPSAHDYRDLELERRPSELAHGRVSVDVGAFAHDGKILAGIELALTPVAAALDGTLAINQIIEGSGAEAAGLVAVLRGDGQREQLEVERRLIRQG